MKATICEVCGAPGTTLVDDWNAVFSRYGANYNYRRHSRLTFCDAHARDSQIYEPSLPFGMGHAEFVLTQEER